jgi:hypothetical protein
MKYVIAYMVALFILIGPSLAFPEAKGSVIYWMRVVSLVDAVSLVFFAAHMFARSHK